MRRKLIRTWPRYLIAATIALTAVLTVTPALLAADSPADEALARINFYRSASGVPAVVRHELLEQSAQNHADYYLANQRYSAHDETAGQPGFTGAKLSDRVTAVGYPACFSGENAASVGHSAKDAVDGLVNTVGHRTSMLSPSWSEFGFGMTVYGSVINLGRQDCDAFVDLNFVVRSPGPGQTDVPTTFFPHRETPDPLPSLEPGNFGFMVGGPVSIGTYAGGQSLIKNETPAVIEVFELTDQFGGTPDLHTVNDHGWTYWMAKYPLFPGQTYTVRVKGSFSGQMTGAFDLSWTFSTESAFLPTVIVPADPTPKPEYLFVEEEEPNGYFRFYTQTSGVRPMETPAQTLVSGFRVEDFDDRYGETGFLTMFERVGFTASDVPVLGYPLSNVVSHRGVPVQFFQRGVLRRIGTQVQFLNIFDDLAKLKGVDDVLETVSRIPAAIEHPEDAGKSIAEIETSRLDEMREVAPAVYAYVTQFSSNDRLARFGLPVSWQDFDGLVGVRFQRMGFRQPAGETNPGMVDQVLGGEKAKLFEVYLK